MTLRNRIPPKEAAADVIQASHKSLRPSPIRERDHAFCLAMASTGCRVHELAGLRWEDLEIRGGTARAQVRGKGGAIRYVFFNRESLRALRQYRRARADRSSWLFLCHSGPRIGQQASYTALSRAVLKLASEAGLKFHFTTHSFRHDFGMRAIRSTGNLALVQDLLGHSSPVHTRVYATLTVDDLAQGHRAIPGPGSSR